MVARYALKWLTSASLIAGSDSLDFLVMGCWGGVSNAPYTTRQQRNVAASMNAEAQSTGAKFALALGDNFYFNGVTSVDDPRFQQTFEDVFTGSALSASNGFNFKVVAGNHDYLGSVDAQIEYSSRNPRWDFPAKYYTFTEHSDGKQVQFVMIDVKVLAGASSTLEEIPGDQLPGPECPVAAGDQLSWLEQTLASSTADYIIVAGHYPMYSVSPHGPTTKLQREVLPMLRQYKVSAYLSAHDHSMQHIDVGDGVEYHVIGASSIYVTAQPNAGTIAAGQLKYFGAPKNGGFATVHVSSSGMQIKHLDGDGQVLHTGPVKPPRSGTPTPSPIPTPTPVPTPPPPPTPTPSPSGSCSVGDTVTCQDGTRCKGGQCCRDGSTCPSADNGNLPSCHFGKASDCTAGPPPPPAPSPTPAPTPTPAPSPAGSCSIGETVLCPVEHHCAGKECCQDGSTCPSANNADLPSCSSGKTWDCTTSESAIVA